MRGLLGFLQGTSSNRVPASGPEVPETAEEESQGVARRKVQISWGGCAVGQWDALSQLHLLGFEKTGAVRSQHILLGWLPADKLDEARALPCIAMVSDDYPYLIQEA